MISKSSKLRHALIISLLVLCTASLCSATFCPQSSSGTGSLRSEQQLNQSLQRLLRTLSVNIINLDKGFSMRHEGKRLKFKAIANLPNDQRCYRISGPEINGILEMKIGDGFFYDVEFCESSFDAPYTGRFIRIDELRFRRR